MVIWNASTLQTDAGALTITGNGTGDGSYNESIVIYNSGTNGNTFPLLIHTGSGALTITSTAANSPSPEAIDIEAYSGGLPVTISSATGNITITGSTGINTGSSDFTAVYFVNTNISTGGTGTIAITGLENSTGGSPDDAYGIMLDSNGVGEGTTITTANGSIILTGTGADGLAGIYSTDSTCSIGGAGEHGNITLIAAANDIDLNGMPITTNGGNIMLQAAGSIVDSAGATITTGGGSVTLDADTALGGGAISLTGTSIATGGGGRRGVVRW